VSGGGTIEGLLSPSFVWCIPAWDVTLHYYICTIGELFREKKNLCALLISKDPRETLEVDTLRTTHRTRLSCATANPPTCNSRLKLRHHHFHEQNFISTSVFISGIISLAILFTCAFIYLPVIIHLQRPSFLYRDLRLLLLSITNQQISCVVKAPSAKL
jgi:hypothetical protein